MNRTKSVGMSTAVILLVSVVCARSEPKGGAKEARSSIEAANAKFGETFERGDAAGVAAFYTTDAIVFPPDSQMVKGRQAITEFWQATMKSGVKGAKLTTIDVGRSGDVAYETGTVVLTIQPEGKAATTASAKYLVVWKRQSDGSWQLHRDIWNDLPAAKQ